MIRAALIGALLVLGGCGIDGPPTKPEGGIPESGAASVGVVGGI